MDQAIIDAIAEDAVRLRDALQLRLGSNNTITTPAVAAAMPAIVTYETGLTRYPAEKI